MNFANFLTISRVILILPVLFFISEDSGLNNWLALFLFVSAGVTDNLDGYIARKTGTESSLGALLDLLADKLLVIITTAYLISYQTHESLLIPAFIIIFREIIISSLRQFLAENSGGNPVKVSCIAKTKTTVQITALSFLIISPNFGQNFHFFTIILFWLAAIISLYSLYDYFKTYKKIIK